MTGQRPPRPARACLQIEAEASLDVRWISRSGDSAQVSLVATGWKTHRTGFEDRLLVDDFSQGRYYLAEVLPF